MAPTKWMRLPLLLILGMALNASAFATEPIRIALKNCGGQKCIQGKIGDHELTFLLSTAEGFCSLSPKAANACSLTSGLPVFDSKTASKFPCIESAMVQLEESGFRIEHLLVREPETTTAGIDGILSLKAFEGRLLTLDPAANLLIIENEESYAAKKKEALELETVFATGYSGLECIPYIQGSINNQKCNLLFDFANVSGLSLSKELALQLKLSNDSLLKFVSVAKSGEVSLAIHDAIAEKLPSLIQVQAADARLNYPFISGNTWIFDLRNKRIGIIP